MAADWVFHFDQLNPTDCERLLREQHLGRVGFVRGDQPLVLPVNYVYAEGGVVFSTGVDTVLARAAGGARVAFEIDGADAQYHEGWSVLVLGQMDPVTDPTELDRVAALPVRTWVRWPRRRWLQIRPSSISGRRIRHG